MENIQIWFMENWQLFLRMIHHQIFFEWACWLVGSLLVLLLGAGCLIRLAIKSNPTEKPDRIVYKIGMWAFAIQAIIFIVYPILYKDLIMLFSLILFTPFVFIILIDVFWFFILKAKYENNPEDYQN